MKKVTDNALLDLLNQTQEAEEGKKYPESSLRMTPVTDKVLLSELNEEDHTLEDWLYDGMMSYRAILDGYYYGFSDEIGASVAAGMAKVLEPELTKDKSFSDVRRAMIKTLEEQQVDWAKDHGALSVGLNVLGAIGSGTMAFKAAQSLSKGFASVPGIQPVVQATQEARLQAALRQMDKVPSPTTALEASIAAQPKVAGRIMQSARTALPYAPLLAVEGGLAGIGYAEQGADLTQAAASGATTGLVVGLPMVGALNYVGNALSKNRLAQQLGKDEDFVPLSVALKEKVDGVYERTLGWVYNQFLNKTFGGDTFLEQQTKRITAKADSTLAKEGVTTEQAVSNANKKLAQAKDETATNNKIAKLEKEHTESKAIQKFDVEDAAAKVKADAVKEADAAANAANAAFRVETQLNSLPVGTPKNIVEDVAKETDPQARQAMINNAWSGAENYAFGMIKEGNYRINQREIARQVELLVNDELAELSPKLTGGVAVGDFILNYLARNTNRQGWISGEELTRIRTELSRIANQFPDQGAGAVEGVQIRKLVDIINDTIENQLKGPAKDAFIEEKLRWMTNLLTRQAVLSATKKGGQFTPEQYLASVQRQIPKKAQEGSAPFQKQAELVEQTNKNVDAQIKEAAEQTIKVAKRQHLKRVSEEAETLRKQVNDLKIRQKQKNMSAEQTAEVERKLAEGNERLLELKQYIKELKKVEDAADTSPLMRLFYTSILGGGFNPLMGVGISMGLSQPGVQRALVGQTGLQQLLARGMEAGAAKKATVATIKQGDSGAKGAESGTVFEMDVLMSQSDARKIKAFEKLSRTGRLEEVKRLNPKVYRSLVEAVERGK